MSESSSNDHTTGDFPLPFCKAGIDMIALSTRFTLHLPVFRRMKDEGFYDQPSVTPTKANHEVMLLAMPTSSWAPWKTRQ